jgi:flagellar FliJ protein
VTKNFTLQPLVNLAHQKNDAATRKLGQLNQQRQAAQKKLDTLLQYRKDYQLRFQEATRNGMDQTGLRNFQDFLNRLDEAIAQQRTATEQAGHSVQAGRNELQDAQRRMKSFDTLAQRHADAGRQQAIKSEQRMHDEQTGRFAALKHAKNSET